MKFLLVKPHESVAIARRLHGFLHLEPLELEMVAAGIERKHDAKILDLSLVRNPTRDFAKWIRDYAPDVLGLTGYSSQSGIVKELASLAKRMAPRTIVVVGGIHATILPQDYHCPDCIDYVVRGEGGAAIRELARLLEGPAGFEGNEQILWTRSPRFRDLADLPPPAPPETYPEAVAPRRDLVDRSRYFCVWHAGKKEKVQTLFPRTAAVRSSVGCPHRCRFCVVHHMMRGRYLQRKPEDVIREIEGLEETHVYFVDDEMFINAERSRAIAQGLLDRGIRKRYISWARSDTICKHRDVFALWKEAGLSVLYVGLESMEERNLQDYQKGCDTDVNWRAVEILRELGIGLHAALIVNPDFSGEDFAKLRKVIEKLVPGEVTFTVFSPPPGTELWKEHAPRYICPEPLLHYDCMHTLMPTRLPLNRFYKHFALLYLLGFRGNPWRANRVRPPLRELLGFLVKGAMFGWTLRRIYRDYDRKLW